MRKILTTVLFVSLTVLPGYAEEATLESFQPVVVETTPRAGKVDVDASLNELRVTFSKDMKPGSWSWAMSSNETFPEMTGAPKYLSDKRTCVLPVKLKPDKIYEVWLNSQKFSNFKDTKGRSALPYLLTFKTRK